MKKLCLLILGTFLFYAAPSQSLEPAGMWEGTLNVGISLRLVFHFSKDPSGSWTGSLDSPDQGAKGIAFSSVSYMQDSVLARSLRIGGLFRGELKDDSTLSGLWIQGGRDFPLILHRVAHVEVLVRPQTPKPPYSYQSEEVGYDNSDKSIHFGGTFTYPKQGGPFATAILITGSGQQDRDETIFGHKPFAVIADYLTKRGYAVLRVDDRGIGQTSAGDLRNATSLDFAKDVESGIAYLKTRPQVDPHKIGLIGHSEGGLIASIVASEDPGIDFVIFLAGPGVRGTELLTDQVGLIMQSEGLAASYVKAFKPLYRSILKDGLQQKDTVAAIQQAMASIAAWKKTTPDSAIEALHLSQEESVRKMASAIIKETSTPWFKFFLSTDPAIYIQKLHCKALALDGSRDIQVAPQTNLAAIRSALEKSHSPEFATKELQGLNHLFQKCKTCTLDEYGTLTETFDPSALEAMGDWLDAEIKK